MNEDCVENDEMVNKAVKKFVNVEGRTREGSQLVKLVINKNFKPAVVKNYNLTANPAIQINDVMPETSDLHSAVWYHGKITRQQAQNFLLGFSPHWIIKININILF